MTSDRPPPDRPDPTATYVGQLASAFFRRNGAFAVRTDGPDGTLGDYEIKYTFGTAPLQQAGRGPPRRRRPRDEGSLFHDEEGYYDASMTATLRLLHRWIGLALGPLVLLFALSGAALVVGETIEDALEGRARPIRATGPAAPVPTIVEIARARFPGAEPRGVRAPRHAEEPYRVLLHWRGDRLEVWVDPYAREVIRTRLPDRSVLVAVHSLHASLHLGGMGSALVAAFGLALAAESALGIWVWWPGRGGATGRLTRFHQAVGVLAAAGTLVLALTGVYLAARHAVTPGAAAMSAPAPEARGGLAERLHRGEFAGGAGRAAWVATGLALPVLVLSGYALSIRR